MQIKQGIILAGGEGSRLRPFTHYISKSLLNVNGLPVIEYPINTLKQMGVENLTITVGSSHSGQILDYVQDGSQYGMNISYRYQKSANGIASAINLCQKFIDKNEQFAVVLGDNIFDQPILWDDNHSTGAQVVLRSQEELQRFGVASVHKKTDEIVKLEEKPQTLDDRYDNYAVTGCYLFDYRFFEFFKNIQPSQRGEFEIVDIIKQYHDIKELYPSWYQGFWQDAGTPQAINEINHYLYQKNKA